MGACGADHVGAGTQLLNAMFVYSGMDDREVASVAGDLVVKTEQWLEELVSLQATAAAYADEYDAAEALYEKWHQRFPESQLLEKARRTLEDLRGDR